MRQKEAKIEASATTDGTNLSEPIVSKNRRFKQKSFSKKKTENIYTAWERRSLSK